MRMAAGTTSSSAEAAITSAGVPPQSLHRRADIGEAPGLRIEDPDDVLHALGEQPVELGAAPERLVGELALGHVLHREEDVPAGADHERLDVHPQEDIIRNPVAQDFKGHLDPPLSLGGKGRGQAATERTERTISREPTPARILLRMSATRDRPWAPIGEGRTARHRR